MLIEAQIIVGGKINVLLPGDLGRNAIASLMAAIEGIGNIEKLPDLLVLEYEPVVRKVSKAVRGLRWIINEGFRIGCGDVPSFTSLRQRACRLANRSARPQNCSDH